MLTTTFAKAKEANACIESYRKMAKALGGIKEYGTDTPLGLDKILEVCGLQDTIWSLRCILEPAENILIEFACQCAEHVLHFYEDKYPNDKRPRKAIEAARACVTDKSSAESAAWSAWSAESAAWSAARSAWSSAWSAESAARSAWSAAWSAESAARSAESAARSAARSAETEWQTKTLLELLKK